MDLKALEKLATPISQKLLIPKDEALSELYLIAIEQDITRLSEHNLRTIIARRLSLNAYFAEVSDSQLIKDEDDSFSSFTERVTDNITAESSLIESEEPEVKKEPIDINKLYSRLGLMSSEEENIFYLKHVYGLNNCEIARELGVSPPTIFNRLKSAHSVGTDIMSALDMTITIGTLTI
jgi:DNA-directed RNA polymerase specialized sigma24 family protein